MEPRNPRLDRYILSLTKKRRPRVCFLATASGDSPDYLRRFHQAFRKHHCLAIDLPLFVRDGSDPAEVLLQQDVIYVGGGNTANLLAIWRMHGVDRALRRAWEAGIVLCGISAGMNCWFEASVTDSFGPLRELRDGLGFLRGSACPHFDGEAERRPVFHRLIREHILPAGVAADDGAAIHYVDGKIRRCIASRPHARVYHVSLHEGAVAEEPLPTALLSRDGKMAGMDSQARKTAANG
jgi:peptidase E